MTFLGAVVMLVFWYVFMGAICTGVSWKNGSLRATQQDKYDGHQFSMAGIVLFVFVFWPYLMYRNYRYPEKFKEFEDAQRKG